MRTQRPAIGQAPRWVTRHVVAVVVGLTLVVVLYVVAVVVANETVGWWRDGPPLSPRVVISGAVVVVLLDLARLHHAGPPADRVDRSYYRTALWFIGLYGLMGTWFLGTVVAAVLLAHSFLTDREPARGR